MAAERISSMESARYLGLVIGVPAVAGSQRGDLDVLVAVTRWSCAGDGVYAHFRITQVPDHLVQYVCEGFYHQVLKFELRVADILSILPQAEFNDFERDDVMTRIERTWASTITIRELVRDAVYYEGYDVENGYCIPSCGS